MYVFILCIKLYTHYVSVMCNKHLYVYIISYIYNIYIYTHILYIYIIYVIYIYMIFDHQSHGTCKVWCLQHFAATVAHVLKDEIDEIASILSQANPRPW